MNSAVVFPLQLAGIVVSGMLWQFVETPVMWSLLLSLGFSHYLLSLYYSRTQLVALATAPHFYFPLLVLCFFGASLYVVHLPLLFFFAIHHAFNEVYLRNRKLPAQVPVTALRLSGVLLHLVIYFLLIQGQWLARLGYLPLALSILVLLAVAYFYCVFSIRQSLTPAQFLDNCVFEITALCLIPVALAYSITFEQIVFYHFVFWVLYPLSRLVRAERFKDSLRFAGWTVGITVLFVLVSPLGITAAHVPQKLFNEMFVVGSFIHITSAAALSTAHPDWVIRWFRTSSS